MRNVLQQLIQLYPNDNAVVAMDSGNNSSGRLGSLLPAGPNAGLLQLVNSQGVPQEAVSICRIASVRITSASYNNAITYLPVPVPPPTGCDADCEAAIRSYLPVGTTGVAINAGGQTVANGSIIRNEFGMVVVVGPNSSDPAFVSTCKAEIIKSVERGSVQRSDFGRRLVKNRPPSVCFCCIHFSEPVDTRISLFSKSGMKKPRLQNTIPKT